MNSNDPSGGGTTRNPVPRQQDEEAAKNRLRTEADSASGAAQQAAASASREAEAVGEEVRHFAEEQAEKVKDATADHMDVFADALSAASAELRKGHSGPAAEMVTHAASGLETLSRSLHGKSTTELLDSVRQFGRQNPVGFVAGSLLAGFALSRFAVAGPAPAAGSPASGASPSASERPASQPSASAATPSSTQGGNKR